MAEDDLNHIFADNVPPFVEAEARLSKGRPASRPNWSEKALARLCFTFLSSNAFDGAEQKLDIAFGSGDRARLDANHAPTL